MNIRYNTGITPLQKVIEHNHDECMPLLLTAGADVNTTDNKTGTSASLTTVAVNKLQTFGQLLTAGSDVNIVNNSGDTTLIIAAVRGNVAVAKRLLKTNCRINKADGMIQNALTSHLKCCHPVNKDLVSLLFATGEILDEDDSNNIVHDVLELKEIKVQLSHVC